MLGNGKDVVALVAAAGRSGDKRRGTHSRKTAHAFQKRFVEGDDFVASVVLLFRQAIFDGEDAIGGAAQIGGTEVQEAFEEEAGGDEQDDGKSDLCNEEDFAKRG